MATLLGGAYAIQAKRVLAQNRILRVGGPIIPPYWHMQVGAPAGSLVELMRKVTSEAGFEMKADIFPSARLAYEIIQGSVDLVVTMRHSRLDEAPALLRSAEPIAALWLNLYSHRTPVVIRTQDDLRGRTVAVVRGYGYGALRAWLDRPESGVVLVEVNDARAALLMVSAGRVPFALAYDINYDHAVAQLGGSLPDVVTNPMTMLHAHLYLNREVVSRPEETLAALVAAHGRLVARGEAVKMPGHDLLFSDRIAAP